MILLASVLAGILFGWAYARWKGETWRPPIFRATWLVVLGFLPQLLAIYLPLTRHKFPDGLASLSLIISQTFLLAFTIVNRRLPGMQLIIIGLCFNLLAILVNGGFMPLPVNVASRLWPESVLTRMEVGGRISAGSKDILLPEEEIVLPWLADKFLPPDFINYRFAFSLGDVFVSLGTFWLLVKQQLLIIKPS